MGILTNGPGASIGEIVTDWECQTLQGLLKLLRSKRHPAWLETFLERLAIHAAVDEKLGDRPIDVKEILSALLNSVNEGIPTGDVEGLLYQGGTLTTIDPDEHAMMLRYLAVQRSESWLANFMDIECSLFASQKNRTPEQVIRGLAGSELETFGSDLAITRRMLELHPDLFTAEIEGLAPKPAEPPDTPQSARKPLKDPRMFQLTMVDKGDVKEPSNLTRREFKELKKHLATMRARKARRGKAA